MARRVINASGVVLHTNLGRAPLSDDAIEAMRRTAQGYSDLELDLGTGRRGSRQAHISELVARVTGTEAALVVNNNASAVMLGLAAIAHGKELSCRGGRRWRLGAAFAFLMCWRRAGDSGGGGHDEPHLRARLRGGD